MKELLDNALKMATSISSTQGGMASVQVRYNPYEAAWECHASWSNNALVHGRAGDPESALRAMILSLHKFKQKVRQAHD